MFLCLRSNVCFNPFSVFPIQESYCVLMIFPFKSLACFDLDYFPFKSLVCFDLENFPHKNLVCSDPDYFPFKNLVCFDL